MDSDFRMVNQRLAGLRLALSLGVGFGLVGVVPDLLFHAYSVAVSGCPKTLGSFISCGGRGPHMEFLYALGILCGLALAYLVGRSADILIRGGLEDG